jgi:hypothetical protein
MEWWLSSSLAGTKPNAETEKGRSKERPFPEFAALRALEARVWFPRRILEPEKWKPLFLRTL